MANINWRHTIPSEGSLVGIGANDIRHQKRQIDAVLNESFNLGDDTTPVKAGSALPIYQAASKNSYGPTGPATDHWYLTGQVFVESDTSRAYSYTTIAIPSAPNSNATTLIGTAALVEHGESFPRATWIERSDFFEAATAGSYTIDFDVNRGGIPGEPQGFDGIPTVLVSAHTTLYASIDTTQVQVTDVQQDTFTIYTRQDELQVHWTSLGTVGGDVGGTN